MARNKYCKDSITVIPCANRPWTIKGAPVVEFTAKDLKENPFHKALIIPLGFMGLGKDGKPIFTPHANVKQ